MGQQQLLLVVLGLILISISVVLGYALFLDNSSSSNRDHVINDLQSFAGRAHSYYRKTRLMGGGGTSFTGITVTHLSNKSSGSAIINVNGIYTITSISGTQMIIHGKGIEIGYNGATQVEADMFVRSGVGTDSVAILN
jgi:hypothetical protein